MNFEQLQKSIAEQQLGNARLTDIKKGVYSLALPAKDGEQIYLVGTKNAKYPIGLRSLAAMRVVTGPDKITVKTTREARENANFNTLQNAIVEDKLPLTEATKFEVVGHLRIHDAGTDGPIYKNEHYKGYPEYVKTTRKIANQFPAGKEYTDAEKTVRNTMYTEAAEALRSSGVKTGVKDEDNNFLLMPVFTVSN
jgi:hypothetical protein